MGHSTLIKNVPIFIIFFFSGFMACFSFAFIAYKNFNFKVAKLLLKQVNVLTILLLASLNLVIDIAKPTGLDFLYDLVYLGGICILCCIDAVEIKDRILVISMSCISSLAPYFISMRGVLETLMRVKFYLWNA